MRAYLSAAVCATALFTSGCATVFTGTTDAIAFDSQPQGARVEVDGVKVGHTPLTVQVKRSLSPPTVTLSMDRYKSRDFTLYQELNFVSLFDFLFLPAFIVDAQSGAILKYSILDYDMKLKAKTDR